jgi:two-component system sensor histidine kinase CreC
VSLTARLLTGFIVLALAGYYFVFEPVMEGVERQYLEAVEEPMIDAAELLAGIVSEELVTSTNIPASFGSGLERATKRRLGARIYNLRKERVLMDAYVTDARGVVLYDSAHSEHVGMDYSIYNDVSRTLAGSYGARSTRDDESNKESSVMYVGAPLIVKGQIVGALSVYKPQGALHGFIAETRRELSTLALISVAIFMLVGFLLSRWITAPLARLTQHAAAVSRGERAPPPAMPGRHLRTLADSLERMRDALEDRNYVQSYVQTLSHEMKAPVAAIRGASELLEEKDLPAPRREQFLANIRTEVARLQHLIEQLLSLASLESRKRLENPQRINLAEVASHVVDEMGSQGDAVDFHSSGDCIVSGDEFLLDTALRNLIRNALDFSPPGAPVEVRVTRTESEVITRVLDSGPGIPDYAKEKVFDRFYSLPRPSTGRKSSGLGLCFVREAAALHRGGASLDAREGGGTVAMLTLPAA